MVSPHSEIWHTITNGQERLQGIFFFFGEKEGVGVTMIAIKVCIKILFQPIYILRNVLYIKKYQSIRNQPGNEVIAYVLPQKEVVSW